MNQKKDLKKPESEKQAQVNPSKVQTAPIFPRNQPSKMLNELIAFLLWVAIITAIVIMNKCHKRVINHPTVVEVVADVDSEEEARRQRARAYAQRFGVPQGFRD